MNYTDVPRISEGELGPLIEATAKRRADSDLIDQLKKTVTLHLALLDLQEARLELRLFTSYDAIADSLKGEERERLMLKYQWGSWWKRAWLKLNDVTMTRSRLSG